MQCGRVTLRLAQLASLLIELCFGQPTLSADCAALVAIYRSASVKPWTNSTGWRTWNTTTPNCCMWFGVQCQVNRVISLNLTANGLLGTISPEIGNLHRLQWLSFRDNMLRGQIPLAVTHLKGSFACGSFSGAICNPFATNDPNSQCSGATCNSYGGLQHLDLSRNRLSGQIPVEISRLCRTLTHIDFAVNRLTGTIPATMGALIHVRNLDLFYNRISGPLPPEMGHMVSLMHLNVAFNRLTGTIPHYLGNLERLEVLELSVNRFSGSIPGSLGAMVAPPTDMCDWPGGSCFNRALSATNLSSGLECEPGEYTLWFVQGIRQPCSPFGGVSEWWCQSCEMPFPDSSRTVPTGPCHSTYRPLPSPMTPFFDYVSPPYSPQIPAAPSRSPVAGPRLRISVIPRCIREPSFYASDLTYRASTGVVVV